MTGLCPKLNMFLCLSKQILISVVQLISHTILQCSCSLERMIISKVLSCTLAEPVYNQGIILALMISYLSFCSVIDHDMLCLHCTRIATYKLTLHIGMKDLKISVYVCHQIWTMKTKAYNPLFCTIHL